MKTRKEFKFWNLRIVYTVILLSFAFWGNIYSKNNVEEINLDGREWKNNQNKTRSLSSIPISAYTDGTYLYIQNTNPDCDITVTITNEATGDVVYERTFPQEATSYMVISIADLPAGVYTLELSNPNGGYLTGRFNK